GRIWRVRTVDWKPGLAAFDLTKATTEELVRQLGSTNGWYRGAARKVLADRGDGAAIPLLKEMLKSTGQPALEALWALHAMRALDEPTLLASLQHGDPFVRFWAVRLIGDDGATPLLAGKLAELAATEPDVQVRSQLA